MKTLGELGIRAGDLLVAVTKVSTGSVTSNFDDENPGVVNFE